MERIERDHDLIGSESPEIQDKQKLQLFFQNNWLSTLVLATVLSYLLAKFLRLVIFKNPEQVKHVSKFPTIPHVPFLCPAEFLMLKPEGLLPLISRWITEHGRIIGGWILNQPYILLFKAEYIEKILSSSVEINRSNDYDVIIPWAGHSIVTINGSAWHDRKKLIQPAFHFKNFENFIDIFNEQSTILIEQLSSHCGEKIDAVPFTKRCAMDMICEAGLGEKVNAQVDHESEFFEAAEGMGKLMTDRWVKPHLRIDWLWKLTSNARVQRKCLNVLHGFVRKTVEARLETRRQLRESNPGDEADTTKRAAFLDLLLDLKEAGGNLSMQSLLDETNVFINAGHETTAMSLAWTLFFLGLSPEHQSRIHLELDQVFQNNPEGPVTVSDLAKLKYLDCCIKESLRLCSPVPILTRKLVEDCSLPDGRVLPSGSVTFISIYHLHRDPEYFPDPDSFKPERFMEGATKLHPYAYIPFSMGPRNCIGKKVGEMEVKIVLAHVLRKFKIESLGTVENTKPYPAAVLFPSNGLPIRLTQRFA